ncbi:GNAT family N-acetyltransferase [Lacticaseibacillus kribbianus]|uniref:GNAT family N-acetyltransferase n=1 Tax=Lacticaseibacillus kribbianus TaxID=2926292 RepID=UPI001CD634A3|nr:GNAT family N-acetyltransferase [Lacticaseibacillus kribbianus]
MSYSVTLLKHQTLRTQHLVLRPFQLEDAKRLYEIGSQEKVAEFSINYPTLDAAYAGLADYWMGQPLGKFAVTLNNELIGAAELHADEKNRKAEIGYLLDPAYWGHGYATEAAAAVMALCFDLLGVLRVEAMHDATNPRSGRVMLRLGMHEEGRLEAEHLEKGVPITTVVMAKLRQQAADR